MIANAKVLLPCDPSRVLVVDDERTVRDVFARVIEFYLPQCRVDIAGNGVDGLRQFETRHNGVVLMDLWMPVMDGERAFLELQELCQSRRWQMPSVVFCTGYEPPSLVREAVRDNPAHELLRKPVANDTLIDVIKSKMGG